ncbi:mab-21 domain-containing protein [Nephila pilipes]|uniref:Mab-21 domain-containing protein n=1 Tax=Nephila pilipes TaxID=299642 RepID=A0A8X6PVS5_NEPPI|nr:mab-21 domain-containing protein [Nephila pilipes]
MRSSKSEVLCRITDWYLKYQNPLPKSLKEFWHLVPKLCRGEQEMSISDCKFTWRVNFPEIEKKVLYDKQCAKNVIKLLKLLRDKQNWKTIASYHMNTVILLEVDKSSEPAYWKQGKFLFVRFLEALKQLQGYLRENHLPYFFCAEYNLFHVLNSGTCKNISDRLGRIISSIEADPSNLKLYL